MYLLAIIEKIKSRGKLIYLPTLTALFPFSNKLPQAIVQMKEPLKRVLSTRSQKRRFTRLSINFRRSSGLHWCFVMGMNSPMLKLPPLHKCYRNGEEPDCKGQKFVAKK